MIDEIEELKERISFLEQENAELREKSIAFSEYVLKTNKDIRLFVERIINHSLTFNKGEEK